MEKKQGQITWTETEDGFRVEVKGKDLKEQIVWTETEDGFRIEVKGKELKKMFSCCIPVMAGSGMKMSDCCPSEVDK
jgi:hypothetical protein